MYVEDFITEVLNMRDEIKGLGWRRVKGKRLILEQIDYSLKSADRLLIDEVLLTHLHKQLRLEVNKVIERRAKNV